ncbi:SIMPL domain-containing protein [Rhodococcus tukisamuensis]|uniref:SIMPL domain-containing protein n=1 Tax=Rhodococcus tukisamuensis TaxID=168276 RepID=A0A1G7B9Y8_9NOCA|nr:SIMPL domain-containing protein [Rhodococcus tukisamuensis]SDE23156.1 hypothetical protein SAMN05444580_112117 [Rhodococcus tukisamuensis]
MTATPVAITVTGHAERAFKPNRCTVMLRVAFDGATHEEAADPAAETVAGLTKMITALHEDKAGPVVRWTMDQVHHSRRRPYHRDGKKRPWNYQSTATLTATFRDHQAVAVFVDDAADLEGVDVGRLRWTMTKKARAKRLAQVRDLAVQDALAKARGYTMSLGCTTIHVVALADPGMLGIRNQPDRGRPPARHYATDMVGDAPESLDSADERPVTALEPERLVIRADVEARFEAS